MRHSRSNLRARLAGGVAKAMVRRLRVVASKGVAWALEGHEDGEGNVETGLAEVAQGVGFYARPKAGDRVEAIVVKVGAESGHPMVVALRNQDGVRRLDAVEDDETAVFNSQVEIRFVEGRIEIRTIGGAPLTVLDELVHGTGIDTFTGATYKALGATTSKARAAK